MRSVLALAATLVLLGTSARADLVLNNADAEAHYLKGRDLWKDKDFAKATDEFKAAYKIEANPEILYDLGQVRRLGGDCVSATKFYQDFLKASPTSEYAKTAQQNLDKCKEILGTQEGGQQPPPPDHTGDDHTNDHANPPPPPPPPPVHRTVHPWYTDALGDALAVTGVVGLGVGGAFFAMSSSDQTKAQSATTYSDYSTAIERAQSRRTIAIIGLAGGGALVGAAIIRYATRSSVTEEKGENVSLWFDGRTAGVVAFGRF